MRENSAAVPAAIPAGTSRDSSEPLPEPSFGALGARRLHDIGLSGWWLALMASGEILNSLALASGLAGAPPANRLNGISALLAMPSAKATITMISC